VVAARREALDHEITTTNDHYARLQEQLATLQKEVATITDTLDEPNRIYQRYLEEQQAWEEQRKMIIGDDHDTGSITELTARINEATTTTQTALAALRAQRAAISTQIHEQQLGKATFQRGLYARLQQQLRTSPLIATRLPLEFNAGLVDTGLATALNDLIHHAVKGAFSDETTATELLRKTDINDTQSLAATLERITNLLLDDKDIDNIDRQRKKVATVERIYNLLYGLEYLDVRYSLRIKGRELLRLTPGERGSVLLVFYLLADKDDRPLIIDQPEENLDNQSLCELVVPCIKEAKKRRQIIMVTHNPNLAVVCDAEQVIWCEVAKDNNNTVTYRTGSIENPELNKHVVDVLEGTWKAFNDRGKTYQKQKSPDNAAR
jgi:DNA repair exonuclease SbcCD ATPase subunit